LVAGIICCSKDGEFQPPQEEQTEDAKLEKSYQAHCLEIPAWNINGWNLKRLTRQVIFQTFMFGLPARNFQGCKLWTQNRRCLGVVRVHLL